jgi:hypothetical protein
MIAALRRARRCVFGTMSMLLFVGVPFVANAQVVATSFQELQGLVKPGDTIEVTNAAGRKVKGRLGELTPSSLELLVRKTAPDGRETFAPQPRMSQSDVRQIRLEHRDSVWNGTIIGAAIGAAPWLAFGTYAAAVGGGSCGSDFNVCPAVALFVGPIGAGIGALIDASKKKRDTVYVQPAGQPSSNLQISPVLSKSATGIRMSLRF